MNRLLTLTGLTAAGLAIGAGIALLAITWCQTQNQADTQNQLRQQLTTTTTQPAVTLPPPTLGPAQSVTRPTTTAPPATLNLGDPLGTIRIPSIDLDQVVVYGIGVQQLKGGPGLYPQSATPADEGLTAIAAHRTTNGAPFRHLDKLNLGDTITIDTLEGVFTYQVQDTIIITPDDMSVLDGVDGQLVLTACNPVGSARERIVIQATEVNPQPKETQ